MLSYCWGQQKDGNFPMQQKVDRVRPSAIGRGLQRVVWRGLQRAREGREREGSVPRQCRRGARPRAQVRQVLENNGSETWMDIHRMAGSTLSAMANAVEESSAILVMICRAYKGLGPPAAVKRP